MSDQDLRALERAAAVDPSDLHQLSVLERVAARSGVSVPVVDDVRRALLGRLAKVLRERCRGRLGSLNFLNHSVTPAIVSVRRGENVLFEAPCAQGVTTLWTPQPWIVAAPGELSLRVQPAEAGASVYVSAWFEHPDGEAGVLDIGSGALARVTLAG